MFARLYRPQEGKEVLFNVDHISRIEVEYAVPGREGDPNLYRLTLDDGIKNPNAVRVYTVHVGGEEFRLAANPDDPIIKVFEEIYKKALKA
jgi:hypothetical protein